MAAKKAQEEREAEVELAKKAIEKAEMAAKEKEDAEKAE